MARYASLLRATVAVAVLTGALPAHAAESKTPAATEQTLPAIVVVAATSRKMVDRVMVTGSIISREDVNVAPQVEGLQIHALNVDVGDKVKAGDVLATLNDDTLILQKSQLIANKARVVAAGAQVAAQLTEAKANGDEATRVAKRAETLAASGTISVSQADQARAAAISANARVNSAAQAIEANKADMNVIDSQIADIDLRLQRTGVKAPVDGVITARNARVGSIASGAGQPMFIIMKDGIVEMQADVAEDDMLRLADGQKVNLEIAGGASVIGGTVRLIEPVIDMQTRLGKVRIALDDVNKARAGMFASANVIVSERDTLALPLTAVAVDKTGSYVRKVEDGRVKMVPVTIGVVDGEYIEVASGIAAGDEVVLKAGAYVRDGDRINPVRSDLAVAN